MCQSPLVLCIIQRGAFTIRLGLRLGLSQTTTPPHGHRHHRRLARLIQSDSSSARGHPPSCKPQLILIVINGAVRLTVLAAITRSLRIVIV